MHKAESNIMACAAGAEPGRYVSGGAGAGRYVSAGTGAGRYVSAGTGAGRYTLAGRTAVTRGLLVALCTACLSPLYADRRLEQGPPPDAIIEHWEQHWTLKEDGSTVYHTKQHVRLNSDRAYRQFADPRITYNVDTDELEIITARVKRADGSYRELPDYSHAQVSPSASAGWPAFASIRQHLIVMSGIEPGCVVELEHKITSKPGARPYLAADVRLDHRYPVRARGVAITTPPGVEVSPVFSGLGQMLYDSGDDKTDTERLRYWTFPPLPGAPDEPNSPPWRARRPRFTFSLAGTTQQWLGRALGRIDAAASESDLITKLAADWTAGCFQPAEKLRAIQQKLADSFNFVEFDATWRPAQPRAAPETLRSNYGMPEEAAAVFLSLARAAGVPVRLGVLTSDDVRIDDAPQRAFVKAYVLLLDGGSENVAPGPRAGRAPEIWDAHRGRIVRDSQWAGYAVLSLADGQLERTPLPAWTNADQSRCAVRGSVTLSADGDFAGNLSLRTTGLFVSSESLRSNSAQESRVEALVQRVLPEAEIESFTVKTLGANEFAADVKIKSSQALKKLSGAWLLQLAENGPLRANVPLPLNHSARTNPVRLPGAFDEQIELTVEWPDDWNVDAYPQDLPQTSGDWGQIGQSVALGENRLTLKRHTRVLRRDLSAESFLELRGPLNELRTDAARTLLLRP